MTHAFYPFVENEGGFPAPSKPTPDKSDNDTSGAQGKPADTSLDLRGANVTLEVKYPARIAVYDDVAAAPRVVVVEPKGVRDYLEEITNTVVRLEKEQGGSIPFMVIREVVENFIHAYFIEPTISILDGGETIRFSDQGPGIREKERALEYGTTSATESMKQYIRGVGSGLPYAQQYMADRGGTLTIEDNISGGTIVTISALEPEGEDQPAVNPMMSAPQGSDTQPTVQATYAGDSSRTYPNAYPSGYPGMYQQGIYPQNVAPAPYPGAPYPVVYPTYQAPWPGMAPMVAPAAPREHMQQMPPYATTPAPEVPMEIALTERGRKILSYLSSHESVGGADLARTFGSSQPTWSRELHSLEEKGLIRKRPGGQRRELTDSGRAFLSRFPQT
ncbi:MAG: MarR family transcriptional regulator [Olsenella sp.]|nr:MarR family transcriptional regulator [Olsenella sp.]